MKVYIYRFRAILVILLVAIAIMNCNKTDNFAQEKQFLRQVHKSQAQKPNPKIVLKVKKNEGLFQTLSRGGLNPNQTLEAINALRYEIEIYKIKPNEKIIIELSQDSSFVESIEYQPNIAIAHKIQREGLFYQYYFNKKPLRVKYELITGTLSKNSSLNNELIKKKISNNVIATANRILQVKVNLKYKARPKDRYQILIEKEFYKKTIINSRLLFVSYQGQKVKKINIFRYFDSNPKSSFNAFYTSRGEALKATGLRYPIGKIHISSRFGRRIHPITGKYKMHNGVDYSARRGSPVYAVAKGVVTKSTYNRYSGNYIVIQHTDKTQSYYLHLQKRLVNKGRRVRAGQTIGKVGTTGLSTGPHLHFGFRNSRGKWINPQNKRMIAAPRLKNQRLKNLKNQIKDINNLIAILQKDQSSSISK